MMFKESKFWHVNVEDRVILRMVICTKDDMDSPWITRSPSPPLGLGVWEHVRSLLELFWVQCSLKVGDGRKIRFWQDSWVGHSALMNRFPIIF